MPWHPKCNNWWSWILISSQTIHGHGWTQHCVLGLGGSINSGAGSVKNKNWFRLGTGSKRFQEIQTSLSLDGKEFQVSTANAVIMLFNPLRTAQYYGCWVAGRYCFCRVSAVRPTKKHSVWSAGSNPAVHRVLVRRDFTTTCTYMCTTARVLRGEGQFKPAMDRVLVCRDFTTTCTCTCTCACARWPVFDLYLYFTPCPGERCSNRYIYFVITSSEGNFTNFTYKPSFFSNVFSWTNHTTFVGFGTFLCWR